jgi:hypothetical protein
MELIPCHWPAWTDEPDLEQVPYVHDGDFIVDRSPVSMDELDELILDATMYLARARHGHTHCLSLYLDQIGTNFDHIGTGAGGFTFYSPRDGATVGDIMFNPTPSDCYRYFT